MGKFSKQKQTARGKQSKSQPEPVPVKNSPAGDAQEAVKTSPQADQPSAPTVSGRQRTSSDKTGRVNMGFANKHDSICYFDACKEIGLCLFCFTHVLHHDGKRFCSGRVETVPRNDLYDRLKFLQHFDTYIHYDDSSVLWYDFNKGELVVPSVLFDAERTKTLCTDLDFNGGKLLSITGVCRSEDVASGSGKAVEQEQKKEKGKMPEQQAPIPAKAEKVPEPVAVPKVEALVPVIVPIPPIAPVLPLIHGPIDLPKLRKYYTWNVSHSRGPKNTNVTTSLRSLITCAFILNNYKRDRVCPPKAPLNPIFSDNVNYFYPARISTMEGGKIVIREGRNEFASRIKYGKFIMPLLLQKLAGKEEPKVMFWKQGTLAFEHAKGLMELLNGKKKTCVINPISPRGVGSGSHYQSFSLVNRYAHAASCCMRNRLDDLTHVFSPRRNLGRIWRVMGNIKDMATGVLNSHALSRIGRRGYQSAIRFNGHSASYRQLAELDTWGFFFETSFPSAILSSISTLVVRLLTWTGCFGWMAVVDYVGLTSRLVSGQLAHRVFDGTVASLQFGEQEDNLASVAQVLSPRLGNVFSLPWGRIFMNSSFMMSLQSRLLFRSEDLKGLGELVTKFNFSYFKELSLQRWLLFLPKVCYWSGVVFFVLVCIAQLSLGVPIPVTKALYDARPCESHIAVDGGVDVRNSSLRVGDAQKETLRADSNVLYYQLYLSLFGTYWKFVTRERLAYSTALLADLNSPRMQPLSLLGKDSDVLNRIVNYASQSAHLNDNTSEYAVQNTCKLALMFAITRMNKEPFSAPQLGEGNRSGH